MKISPEKLRCRHEGFSADAKSPVVSARTRIGDRVRVPNLSRSDRVTGKPEAGPLFRRCNGLMGCARPGHGRAAAMAELQARLPKSVPPGLKRLRKKAGIRAMSSKSIPQGLKPAWILLAFWRG